MQPWDAYTKSVQTGRRNAGELERLAVEHVLNLRRLYHFDEAEAVRVHDIVSRFRFAKGKWKGLQFELMPHQSFFLAYLFGLKNDKGFRLIREAMLNMSKKGGKSELGGAIGVLMTFFDGEQTAEGYVVANKTEQALFAWKSAKNICTQLAAEYPDFAANFKYYDTKLEHSLIQLDSENRLKTLPYESNTLDGVNPHFAQIDEFHEYPDTSVPDNLSSGMVLRDQPLLLYTTTRGFHPYGPLAEKEEYYTNVLKGIVEDHRVFPLIFALSDDSKWRNKKFWVQFAPGIDYDLPSVEALEREIKVALDEGGEKLVSCKTKNCNMWQRAKADFVAQSDWDAGADPIDEAELAGRECFAAFDLGRNNDLSAVGYLFPPVAEGEKFKFVCRFFVPAEEVQKLSREHKVSYQQWIDAGLVIPAPGNYTDTAVIMDTIRADATRFNVVSLVGDMSFAVELINQLSAEGFEAESFAQTAAKMTAPILKIQSLVGQKMFQHGGNKVLSWMCSNVTLRKNAGGQFVMDKSDRITGKGKDHKKGRKKIDGMVVLAMCLGVYLDRIGKDEKKKSVYEKRELRFV